MTYKNPVIPGFYPDPSICLVGDEFYLVNSSFEFFPGVPVFHSRNLINWEQIGYCISRNSQLKYAKGKQSKTGIYAPTIRYHEGIFYVITTNVASGGEDSGNFYVWTQDPYGEWSDPVFLDVPGIDPSLFFDEDGKAYYIGTHESIYICEVDLKQGRITGERKNIWTGTGGSYPEGPHIYKKDGWYYLLISEGGTERCHMITMARSRKIDGGYEACPYNPVLTNRSLGLPIEATGHADLVQDNDGHWWAVCLGIRTFSYPPKHNLGRETMLVPVDWNGDWPVFGNGGIVEEQIEVSHLPAAKTVLYEEPFCFRDDFKSSTLDLSWNFIYNTEDSLWALGDNGLKLYGNEKTLSDADTVAWIGRRQQHHNSKTRVSLSFAGSQEGEEAGLTIFMNNLHHYEAAIMQKDGKRKLVFRRRIGSLWKIEKELVYEKDRVILELNSDKEFYVFSYRGQDGETEEIGRGEVQYLTTEVGGSFTGNYIALYAVGNGLKCNAPAVFTDFEYCTV